MKEPFEFSVSDPWAGAETSEAVSAIPFLRREFVERPFEMAHALPDALGLLGKALTLGGA